VTSTDHKLLRHGVAAAPGLASGKVFVHAPSEVEREVDRAQRGFSAAAMSLHDLALRAPDAAAVLEAHRLMLIDPMITTAVERYIRTELRCAEWAIDSMAHEIGGRFATLGDAYFRDRGQDLDVVAARVLQELQEAGGAPAQHWSQAVPPHAVVVAHDISPGDAILLSKRGVAALVTEVGGATSHTAILARALALPAVVGIGDVTIDAHHGDQVLVDGYQGRITLRPTADDDARFAVRRAAAASVEAALHAEVHQPAITIDGVPLPLMANVELPEEVEAACRLGAVGVGLYRSEFLFLNRRDIPSVADHHAALRCV
jgi:phosphoenolpyruvate-protein phosphotransferase (PTS system enzyme I)